jgi:hypothetical protein
MDRSYRRRLSKGTTMTAQRAALDCKAFLAGLSLSLVLGCCVFWLIQSATVSGGEMTREASTRE